MTVKKVVPDDRLMHRTFLKDYYQRYLFNDLQKDCQRYNIPQSKETTLKNEYAPSKILSCLFTVSLTHV